MEATRAGAASSSSTGSPWKAALPYARESRCLAHPPVTWLPSPTHGLRTSLQVFNDFARRIGAAEGWSFTDIYSLDEDLLAIVPQPCLAVILLFPVTETFVPQDGECIQDDDVFFMRQYVGNACGTVAAVHALMNNHDRIALGSGPLAELQRGSATAAGSSGSKASTLGEQLTQSSALKQATDTAAQHGQTPTPQRGADVDYHYVCFVAKGGELLELDGTREGPVRHGPIQRDLLHDAAHVIRTKFFDRMPHGNFNMMALVADPTGDVALAAAN